MCKGALRTELTADLMARIVRRHFGWNKMPTPEEVDDFLLSVKEKIPEIQPCASMDTEIIDAIHHGASIKGSG